MACLGWKQLCSKVGSEKKLTNILLHLAAAGLVHAFSHLHQLSLIDTSD
jgi:hypothetical protein